MRHVPTLLKAPKEEISAEEKGGLEIVGCTLDTRLGCRLMQP